MFKFHEFIIEKRKNPDQNPKISAYEALKKYKDDPDIYISFTELPKIGINPLSIYNTPIGIYTYPLKEIWSKIEKSKDTSKIPYGKDRDYIFVLKSKNKPVFVNNMYTGYTDTMLERDIKKMREIYKNSNTVDIEEVIEEYGSAAYSTDTPSIFWNITRGATLESPNPSKAWNILLRKLGYTGFGDRSGKGIIYSHESIQTVFLSKDAFTVEEMVLNKSYHDVTSIRKNSSDIDFIRSVNRITFAGAFLKQLNDLEKSYLLSTKNFQFNISQTDFVKKIQDTYIKKPNMFAELKSSAQYIFSIVLLFDKRFKKVMGIVKNSLRIPDSDLKNFDTFKSHIMGRFDDASLGKLEAYNAKIFNKNLELLYKELT